MIENTDLINEELLAEKNSVVLVILNRDLLESTIKNLNFDKINLATIVMERDPEEPVPLFAEPIFYQLGEEKIPVTLFANIRLPIRDYKTSIWLISGGSDDTNDAFKIKNFLVNNGVPEDNIFYFDATPQISETWLANLRHIEEHGANFFVTGNEYIQADLNMNLIPTDTRDGVILADINQTLRQSYLTAKHVFAHVKPGTVKFVLIGIEPHSFYQNNAVNFLNTTQNLKYALTFGEMTARDESLLNLFNDEFKNHLKNILTIATAEQADVNFDGIKSDFDHTFSVKAIYSWEDASQDFSPDTFDDNDQLLNDYFVLKDYIELCLANGAKPIGVIFPFAPAVRKSFDAKFLAAFRSMIRRLEGNCDFLCVDMFSLNLNYESFCEMTHLNKHGQSIINALISSKLYANNLIAAENFCTMNYDYLHELSNILPPEEYNTLMDAIFEVSAAKIRRKEKIKLAFVLYNPTQWFGDELYKLFSRDKRFETTVILCTRISGAMSNSLFRKDFARSIKQISSSVPNLIVPENLDTPVPPQDVIIFLTPFPSALPYALRAENLTAEVLIAHISYVFDIAVRTKSYYKRRLFTTSWKLFFSSVAALELYAENSSVGMPRGLYSGYPSMDLFFNPKMKVSFKWKMTRPDAKKILWAPHWSIASDIRYATFQWNYQFMYEFAKTHPETSWIFKPHSGLFEAAVKEKIFPSVEDFNKYLQAWNELPNAQVVTGAFYRGLFATSDAMIHDSDTFIAEYQYVDKPMIFLTRDTQEFNDLGKKILRTSYLVDGQDLESIAATIQRVIIEGNDYKAIERREVFDKYLDYPKANGMLASEFIYGSIANEFKETTE